MISTGSAQDDLQIGDVLTDPVGDGKNYTWDGQAWRSSGTVIIAGSKTAGVSANGQQITIYDGQNSAFMNSTFISVGVNLASVGFRATRNTDQTGLTTGYTKIIFNVEEYDRGNYYDAVSSRWTPPAGIVHLDGGLYVSSGLTGGNLHIFFYKNGAAFKSGFQAITTQVADAINFSCDDIASGTDYYEMYAYIATGTSGTINGAGPYTFFSGHSVGGQGPQGIQGPTGPISPTWALLPTGFRAHKNGVAQTGIPVNTATKLTFGFEDYDQGNFFDTVNSRWTPPAGVVHLDGTVYVTAGPTSGNGMYIYIYKNGIMLKRGATISYWTIDGLRISFDDVCNGSDYYELWYSGGAGSASTISGATTETFFSGHMLGGPQGVPGPQGLPGVVDGLVSRVAFSAYANIDQTGVANETWTKVLFQATNFNDASRYNVGTSRWTPPAGRCQITGAVGFGAGAATTLLIGTPILISVFKNGAYYRIGFGSTLSNLYTGADITVIDSCNGTDYYEICIYVYCSSPVTVTSQGNLWTYFQGTQL